MSSHAADSRTPFNSAFKPIAAMAAGSISVAFTWAAPDRIAAMPARPQPAVKFKTRRPSASMPRNFVGLSQLAAMPPSRHGKELNPTLTSRVSFAAAGATTSLCRCVRPLIFRGAEGCRLGGPSQKAANRLRFGA